MEILGLTITRTKALAQQAQHLSGTNRGWWPFIREPFAGAWQQNQELTVENVTAHVAVFACVSLIASDIGKMRFRLMSKDDDGIWSEVENPAFSPFLRKPNGYQIRHQFLESWQISKLLNGNTYVLKYRDRRGVVTGGYVLDPCRVRVLQAPDASVFYELDADNIAAIGERVIVPASEIIFDPYVTLFHPLIGVSPIYACGRAAVQGLTIQNNSTTFFANGSQPSGVLTAPGVIGQETADRIKAKWDTEFTGSNAGKVAVLGDGLTYAAMSIPAEDSQLLEQLKFSSEMVCQAFRVPPHKICVGQQPNYNNIQALDIQYYAQCLQEKIEKVEELLDHGLGLGPTYGNTYGVEGDLDDLLRMDTSTLIKAEKDAAGVKKINESRRRLNLPPVTGGDTVYLQQQDYSIEAINRRDAEQAAPGNAPARSGV
jgi:HK97 family phage portal protein